MKSSLRPAELLAVEARARRRVAGRQLVPAAARLIGVGREDVARLVLAAFRAGSASSRRRARPAGRRPSRSGRRSGCRSAAISALPPACFDRGDRRIDVVDADVAEPGRAGAVLLHLVGQREHAAGRAAVAAVDHAIALILGHAPRRCSSRPPRRRRPSRLPRSGVISSYQMKSPARAGAPSPVRRGRVSHVATSVMVRLSSSGLSVCQAVRRAAASLLASAVSTILLEAAPEHALAVERHLALRLQALVRHDLRPGLVARRLVRPFDEARRRRLHRPRPSPRGRSR